MPSDSCAILSSFAVASGAPPDDDINVSFSTEDAHQWIDVDEAPDVSNGGREYNDILTAACELSAGSRLTGNFTQRHCTLTRTTQNDLPALASGYLQWKHSKEEIRSVPLSSHYFHATVIKTYEHIVNFVIPQLPDEPANIALLQHGFLGCSPVEPSLSIQTITKTLCDLHHFSITFDAYLNILCQVRSRVDKALGHNGVEVNGMCPCFQLVPSILIAQDGNNSLKQIASVGSVDEREFTSTYFLQWEHVDMFKDEVKHWQHATHNDQESSDAGKNVEILSSCLTWKNSAPDQQKKALDIYEVTRMFASACCHGFIIKACEMVQSGEL
ncbi:uncharacterized protein EDB91DRAFT_1078118 [Suillus paluster]|uniref:uncharacterized protein n=1 Tax=Suillus paluster TaxID=48578 RepID=UPI001B8619CE|nr:uncharacterized protein EDB91DRAFT_1078118 [Suillus paluster]KAG1751304.1 hypothetical protein EDB91DRAFT_1078118 [Suillus paluster]